MIYVVRHPRPAVDTRLCFGRSDVDLAVTAPTEIGATLAALPPVDAIYSSPARRCLRLASAVAARDSITICTDERLHEIDFGRWEGRRWDEVPRHELDAWARDSWRARPGGGESLRSLWVRIADFRVEYLSGKTIPGTKSIVVVSHQGPLRVLWAQANGRQPSQIFQARFPYGRPLPLTTSPLEFGSHQS